MPTYVLIGTTQSATKVLDLWNGTSNEASPTDWHLSGFDDSGWSSSGNPNRGGTTIMDGRKYPNGLPDFNFSVTQQAVAPWADPPHYEAEWLNRFHFTTPTGGYTLYDVERFMAASLPAVATQNWLNGWQFTSAPGGGMHVSADEIASHLAGPGGDNVLAFRSAALGGITEGALPSWDTWRLIWYIPDTGGFPTSWGTIASGVNDRGALGTGDLTTHLVPTQMNTGAFPNSSDPRVVKIVSNGKTTLLLDAFGSVYGCGDNSNGLALATSTDSSAHASPVHLSAFIPAIQDQAVDIAIGGDTALVLSRLGFWQSWSGGTVSTVTFPAYADQETTIIAAGRDHYVVAGPGIIRGFGSDAKGQIAQAGSDFFNRMSWDKTSPLTPPATIVSVSAGDEQTLVVTTIGTYGCGTAVHGSLGVDNYDNGVGGNKVIDALAPVTTVSPTQQFGPISAGLGAPQFDTAAIFTVGDGVPHGGAGDDDGTIIYGTDIGTPFALVEDGGGFEKSDFIAAAYAGGMVNGFNGSDSLAVCAGIAPEYPAAGVAENIDTNNGGGIHTSGTTYLWPVTNDIYEIALPTIRAARLIVQNMAGGGSNVTVTANLDWYNGGDFGDFVLGASTTVSVPVGQTRTILARTPSLGVYGLQAYLTHASGTRTNTINATLELILEEETIYRLFTWGYGGYGQMGSGADATTNLYAVAINGLENVSMACVAERTMFAVGTAGFVTARRQHGWVTVIG